MFFKFLTKTILRLKLRFAMGVESLLFGAAAVTAVFTVSPVIGERIGQEFTKYRADLMVQSPSNATQEDHMTDKEKKLRLALAIHEYEKMLAYDED